MNVGVVKRRPVNSIRRAGLVESCTRTCAGCRRNGETAVRRGHGRTGKCTARTVVVRYGREICNGEGG